MAVNSMQESTAISFIKRFANSEQFDKVFKEGMGLVEETANYLDGPGRVDSRMLDRMGAIAYATESMRLTTRLMQLASWLLLQRAISTGELTNEDAAREKHRINLADIGDGDPIEGVEQTPDGLRALVERSLRLLERIRTLDMMINSPGGSAPKKIGSPVTEQISLLQQAFGQR